MFPVICSVYSGTIAPNNTKITQIESATQKTVETDLSFMKMLLYSLFINPDKLFRINLQFYTID